MPLRRQRPCIFNKPCPLFAQFRFGGLDAFGNIFNIRQLGLDRIAFFNNGFDRAAVLSFETGQRVQALFNGFEPPLVDMNGIQVALKLGLTSS